MSINMTSLSPLEGYQLLTSIIVPRPIAFVSTMAEDGVLNLAPFSFFTAICGRPPTICFSVIRRRGEKKDTARNIAATQEFVVNVVSEGFAQWMNQTAAEYLPQVDEFAVAGFTPVASSLVRPPRVGEALISMECRLLEIREYGEMPYAADFVIGEVVQFHLSDDIYRDGAVDFSALKAVGRMGRDLYCRTGDLFEMKRPRLEDG
ncbi:MAG: flavin reductase family protein [Chloroflexi bacterium]|nr:flavin reductase family protein [Chloroflexota bacterium]